MRYHTAPERKIYGDTYKDEECEKGKLDKLECIAFATWLKAQRNGTGQLTCTACIDMSLSTRTDTILDVTKHNISRHGALSIEQSKRERERTAATLLNTVAKTLFVASPPILPPHLSVGAP
jgi:hypothetical protein